MFKELFLLRCANPTSIMLDLNHAMSNSSYFLYGIGFALIVFLRSKILNVDREDGIYYVNIILMTLFSHTFKMCQSFINFFFGQSMGIALFFQSVVSFLYHICPTDLTLQFDTTMMYFICILCTVKIYQVIYNMDADNKSTMLTPLTQDLTIQEQIYNLRFDT